MSAANENPLHPASLAANGRQGVGAAALGLYVWEHTDNSDGGADARLACFHVLMTLEGACVQLDDAARLTDRPAWQLVEAADLLDAACASLVAAVQA